MTAIAAPAGAAAPDTSTFRSLRTRNFRLFFSGQLISQTGTWLTTIAQTLLVLSLTKSGFTLGLLLAAQFGPVLILGAWAGAVADRADKRKLLIRVQTLAMLQSFALGAAVLTHHATLPVIFGLAAFQGVLTAFDNPTRRAFVVEMVDDADLPNAVALNSAVMTGSRVFGPALAGALVVTSGYGWPFIIDAFSYLAVIAGLLMMRPAELHPAPLQPKRKGQVREGLAYIRSDPNLLVPLVMMAIVGMFAFNFSVTIPLLVEDTMGGSTQTFTLLFSAVSVGSVIGALYTARRTEVTTHQLVVASAAFGVTMTLLALAPNLGFAFAAAPLMGLASIAFMTSCTAIVQVLAGPTYRGRVLAIQSMVFLGSTPIGGPIVGWIADTAGARVSVAVGALSCFVAAAYGWRYLHHSAPTGPVDPITTELEAIDDECIALAD
jgi:MFS family permease